MSVEKLDLKWRIVATPLLALFQMINFREYSVLSRLRVSLAPAAAFPLWASFTSTPQMWQRS